MIARLVPALLLLAAATLVLPATAQPIGVGDCQKSGACAGACVAVVASCSDGDVACVGVSYQVPQCVESTAAVSSAPATRCLGEVCDAINAVCYIATKHWCVG